MQDISFSIIIHGILDNVVRGILLSKAGSSGRKTGCGVFSSWIVHIIISQSNFSTKCWLKNTSNVRIRVRLLTLTKTFDSCKKWFIKRGKNDRKFSHCHDLAVAGPTCQFFALQNLVHVPVLRQDDLPLHLIHHDRDTAHPLR